MPAGTAKFAGIEYPVRLNSSLPMVSDFNDLPIKTVNGATIYMKDVATVHDGFIPQTNIVRTNGSRGVLLTITRNGKASTLAIVNAVKDELPRIMGRVTQDLKLSPFGDQSLFVRSAIGGVVRETYLRTKRPADEERRLQEEQAEEEPRAESIPELVPEVGR